MDIIICNCGDCNYALGKFVNVPTSVDGSCVFPKVFKGRLTVDFSEHERGPRGSPYANCTYCCGRLGYKVLNVPTDWDTHPSKGRTIISIRQVVLTTLDGADIPTTEIAHQEFIICEDYFEGDDAAVNAPSIPENSTQLCANNSGSSESHNQPLGNIHTQLSSEPQMEEPQKRNHSGSGISFDEATLRIDDKIEDGVANVRERLTNHHARLASMDSDASMVKDKINNIDGLLQNQPEYTHLEQELLVTQQTIISVLNSVQEATKCLQEEVDKTSQFIKDYNLDRLSVAKQLASLGVQLRKLKEELAEERSRKPSSEPIFPAHEIDILTTSITMLGSKASQIDPLQMELKLLKERVQRLEKALAHRSPDDSDAGAQHYQVTRRVEMADQTLSRSEASKTPSQVESTSVEPRIDEVTPAIGVPTVKIPNPLHPSLTPNPPSGSPKALDSTSRVHETVAPSPGSSKVPRKRSFDSSLEEYRILRSNPDMMKKCPKRRHPEARRITFEEL